MPSPWWLTPCSHPSCPCSSQPPGTCPTMLAPPPLPWSPCPSISGWGSSAASQGAAEWSPTAKRQRWRPPEGSSRPRRRGMPQPGSATTPRSPAPSSTPCGSRATGWRLPPSEPWDGVAVSLVPCGPPSAPGPGPSRRRSTRPSRGLGRLHSPA
jgi:hypothetical protein